MRLTVAAIDAALTDLRPEWRSDGIALFLRVERPDFASALQLVNDVGRIAEAQGHHPDVTFGWGYCTFRLTTHSLGGLTAKDLQLAAAIDATLGL